MSDSRGQNDASNKVVLGRITGAHGINGWIRVFSYADPMESIVDFNPWYIRPGKGNREAWRKVRLIAGRRHAKTVIAKLEHCDDRDQAQAYTGAEIAVEPGQLEAQRSANEYFWHELTGLRVVNRQGIELGVVKNLMETGANDVLVVADLSADTSAEQAAKQRLIPWVMHQVVIAVDLQQRVITVDWDPEF